MIKMIRKAFTLIAITVISVFILSGCAAMERWGDEVNQSLKGVSANMSTYAQDGTRIDEVSGKSFKVTRDERFDTLTTGSEGSSSNKDSQVLLISVGEHHISHVGSTMVMAEEGLTDIMANTETSVSIENNEPGTPWLNSFVEKNRNMWSGKSKTLMIRSQDGTPVATFAGDNVEMFPTDIPKSTWFSVDGKFLLIYRADFTVYDTALLTQ